MKNTSIILLVLFGLLFQLNVNACSIFTCSKNGSVLVGANEDEYTTFHYMWFVPATTNKYGAVFFGKNNMQTQAGMNEHGLFFDFAAIPRIEAKNREINFMDSAEILATCKTVEEALVLYQKHGFAAFSSQMLLADAKGHSVLINADTIVHNVGDFQITTNFNVCDLKDSNYDCLRYEKIEKALSKANQISISFFQGILDDVHQEGKVSTMYSNVYDLKNRKIHINWFHNYHETVTIDLPKELKKGFHMESLDQRFKQKNFAAINFQKSEDAYFYNSLLQEFEKGGKEAGLQLFEQFINKHPDKADRITEDLTWIPFGLISKARIAHDNLAFDYYYISFLNDYKTIWKSKHNLLFLSVDLLDHIKASNLKYSDFHITEMLGYTHIVLGNKTTSIGHYEKAIAVAEKDSWERTRASNTLKKIKSMK